ncbi:MAG: Gfo/Idh/MocA family protein [Spiroplasma sp.]
MKIVFIGAGRITKWFLDDIKNSKYHENIIAYGIYNRTLKKAVQYQKDYKLTKVYQSLAELIDDKDNYDLVYVGTSDNSHYQITKDLLVNKINVFCEKPLALTFRKTQELYDIASKSKVLLFEGIKTGFSLAYQAMKKDLAEGLIGEINYVYTTHAKVSTSLKIPVPTASDTDFVGAHLAGGMYALFIALDLLGSVKSLTYLNNPYNQHHPAISTSVLNLRMKSGAIATVLCSDSLSNDLSTMILGSKGFIRLAGNIQKYNQNYHKDSCHMAYTYEVYDLSQNLIKKVDLPIKTDGEGLNLEIDYIYQLWNNKKNVSLIVSPEISLEIIKILEATNNVDDTKVIIF